MNNVQDSICLNHRGAGDGPVWHSTRIVNHSGVASAPSAAGQLDRLQPLRDRCVHTSWRRQRVVQLRVRRWTAGVPLTYQKSVTPGGDVLTTPGV